MENLDSVVNCFRKKFGREPEKCVFAPGRVNLIGEHVDYNDGFVLPFALPFITIIVGSKSLETTTRLHSMTINSSGSSESDASFIINDELSKGSPKWANYVKGTIFQYLKDLPENSAFDAVVWSNVPIGSGLSSSAALEVATATFLEALYNVSTPDKKTKVLRCQKAEHTFADTPCGVMDQFVSCAGEKNKLVLLDCRSFEYKLVPFGSGDESVVVIVTNSNVKHELSGSEYPVRVKQCQEALAAIQKSFPEVKSLRDANLEMLEKVKESLSAVVYSRAKHVLTEDKRTLATVEALKKSDFKTVGELMNASHESLAKDYEVSCPELDILVDLARRVPGVHGSRMTGGGFGGCIVTLVDRSSAQALIRFLKHEYLESVGLRCECYEVKPSAGTAEIDLSLSVNEKNRNEDKDDRFNLSLQSFANWFVPLTVVALVLFVAVNGRRR